MSATNNGKGLLKTFVDFFGGVGGFHIGLARCGLRCVFACERDWRCRAAYLVNYGILPTGDIYKVEADAVPPHDIASYGLPCQAWSRSGSQGGVGDPRGVLHREMLRMVGHHKPRGVLVENVPQFRTLNGGPAFQEIVQALEGWGYAVHHAVLNAAGFGVPQNRERLYIVAIRTDIMLHPFRFPEPAEPDVELSSILESPELAAQAATTIKKYRRVAPGKIRWDRTGKGLIKLGDVRDNTQADRVYSPRGHSVTLTASTGGWGAGMGLYDVDGVVRRLTPKEAGRCMSFPEDFRLVFAPRIACSQLGNAVVANVVQAVMRQVFVAVGQDMPCRSVRLREDCKGVETA